MLRRRRKPQLHDLKPRVLLGRETSALPYHPLSAFNCEFTSLNKALLRSDGFYSANNLLHRRRGGSFSLENKPRDTLHPLGRSHFSDFLLGEPPTCDNRSRNPWAGEGDITSQARFWGRRSIFEKRWELGDCTRGGVADVDD